MTIGKDELNKKSMIIYLLLKPETATSIASWDSLGCLFRNSSVSYYLFSSVELYLSLLRNSPQLS